MIRRIVCLLLVPALLANQAAICCARAHSDGATGDHSAKLHIHLSGETHAAHPDSHHHGDSDEHNHSGGLPAENSETSLDFDLSLPTPHDNDALFFGDHDNFQIRSNRIHVDSLSLAFLTFDKVMPRVSSSDHRARAARAGPVTPYHCAIFLQTRRILL